MSEVREHLRRWREAGLLDDSAVGRILAFEGRRAAPAARGVGRERPTFTEVLIYLGIAIIAAGVIVLAATNWGHLDSWARIAVPGIPAVAATWAGALMRTHHHPGIRRGGLAAWAAATGLIAGAVAVTLNEAGLREEDTALVSGLVMLLVAMVFWLVEPTDIQVVAGAAAAFLLSMAAAAETSRLSEEWAPTAGTLAMVAFGALAIALVEAGVLHPRITCRLLGGMALAVDGFLVAASSRQADWLEVLPFIVGAALAWLAVEVGFFPYAVLAIVAIFGGTMVTILRHVSDPTYAAVALMAAGVALIAAVILLARFKRGGGQPAGPPRPAGAHG